MMSAFNRLPASRALAWLAGSWGLVKRQPVRLLLIGLFFQFMLSFSQADLLGLLLVLCLPVFSAGMLQAFHLVARGEKPLLFVLFLPFTASHAVSRLLLLGGMVMVLGLLLVTSVLAGHAMDIDPAMLSQVEQGEVDLLSVVDPVVLEKALLALALAAALSGLMTYFPVPLIWFSRIATGRALLLGLRALGRNWRPLLLVGCLLGLLLVPIVLMFGGIYLSAATGGAAPTWLALLSVLLGALFQLLLFGTQYLAFRDIFGIGEPSGEEEREGDDQLLA
jgi:hypothetical protein